MTNDAYTEYRRTLTTLENLAVKTLAEFGELKKFAKLFVRQLKRYEQNFKLADTNSAN